MRRLYVYLGEVESHVAAILAVRNSHREPLELRRLEPVGGGAPVLVAPDEIDLQALDAGHGPWPLIWDVKSSAVVSRTAGAVELLAREGGEARGSRAQDIATVRTELVAAASAAGKTTDPGVYRENYQRVFAALDAFDERLSQTRFLSGAEHPDVADWWLFASLLRFSCCYYGLYKCNRTRLEDFANLGPYVRDLVQRYEIDETIDLVAIKKSHYDSDRTINPSGLYPEGNPDLYAAHDRDRFEGTAVSTLAIEEVQDKTRLEGEFVRPKSVHRNWIVEDGSTGYAPEAGRYHLYIANNCPWCHRVALGRAIKGLQSAISMDVLFYRRDPDRGWQFRPQEPGCTEDTLFGHTYIRELYEKQGSNQKSVPVLFDKQTQTIVSNESAEILRMFDLAFHKMSPDSPRLYPESLAETIDELNTWIYTDINNGAYKAGFSGSQKPYTVAYKRLFAAFERLERLLRDRPFLTGEQLTEADVRLFPTVFRFDSIYYTRFRLNAFMVRDRPNLQAWMMRMLEIPAVVEASNLDHARKGYFGRTGNNIVPLGPEFAD